MIKCPYCKSEKINKNGHYKNVQRYKCKKCGRTFKNKSYNFKSKKGDDFVKALYNLLTSPIKKNQYIYRDVDSSLFTDNKSENAPDNISLKIRESMWENHKRVSCENPRAIMSVNGNEIRVLFLPPNKYQRNCRFTLANERESIKQNFRRRPIQ